MVWIAAIVGVLLLIVFPKQVGALIGILALGFGALLFMENYNSEQRRKERDAVKVEIAYDEQRCSEEFPLYVTVSNLSGRTVDKVTWNVAAKRPSFSDNLAVYSYQTISEYDSPFSSDKILQTNETYVLCFRALDVKKGYDPESLDWVATRKYVTFASE